MEEQAPMQKYEMVGHIRFQGADGKEVDAPAGAIISFDAGDQVDIPFLLYVGAIRPWEDTGDGR